MNAACPPASRMILAVVSPVTDVWSSAYTRAPASANPTAAPLPMPFPAPVIATTWPAKSKRVLPIRSRAPELLRREPRARDERLELRPHDRRMDLHVAGERREAAVGAGDHALAADHRCEA